MKSRQDYRMGRLKIKMHKMRMYSFLRHLYQWQLDFVILRAIEYFYGK